MKLLHEVITQAPRSHGEVHDKEWQAASTCYRLIEEAELKEKTERAQSDFELAAKYFLREFPDMPNDTRGSILATYGVMADVLLRGHMADLLTGKPRPARFHFRRGDYRARSSHQGVRSGRCLCAVRLHLVCGRRPASNATLN
jgi:hypothetical protein